MDYIADLMNPFGLAIWLRQNSRYQRVAGQYLIIYSLSVLPFYFVVALFLLALQIASANNCNLPVAEQIKPCDLRSKAS